MHLEVLVEDQSGKAFLDIALQRIVASDHTFRVHAYKGIGHIPKNLNGSVDASKRILLNQLPRLLSGYGNAFAKYPLNYQAGVVVVCDLDNRERNEFLQELTGVVDACFARPNAIFCLAIEEGEAWLLGDISAIKQAYPNAKQVELASYVNDSICGTWEKLADAVYPGGAQALSAKGWQSVGTEKSRWANNITPHMDFATNQSPSFCHFRDSVSDLLMPREGQA
jgi:hypothetical protein